MMIHVRTIFWTSIVWLVLLAVGYLYTSFWDASVIHTLYSGLFPVQTTWSVLSPSCNGELIKADINQMREDIRVLSEQIRTSVVQKPTASVSSPAIQQVLLWVWGSGDSLVSIERNVPVWSASIEDTINLLLVGQLSSIEKAQWLVSLFANPLFVLQSATLDTGVLNMRFNDVPGFTSGWSARVLMMRAALERTVRQFPSVKSVVILPESILQP